LPSAASCVAFCFLTGLLLFPPTLLLAQAAPSLTPAPAEAPKLALIPMPRELHEVKDISLAQGADVLEAARIPKTSLLPKT